MNATAEQKSCSQPGCDGTMERHQRHRERPTGARQPIGRGSLVKRLDPYYVWWCDTCFHEESAEPPPRPAAPA